MFAFNFTVTLPILVKSVLHGSAADYAFVSCSLGFGAVLGGLYVAHRSRPTRRLLTGLAVAFGGLMAVVAVAPSVLVACLALVPMGFASLAFISTANATLQLLQRGGDARACDEPLRDGVPRNDADRRVRGRRHRRRPRLPGPRSRPARPRRSVPRPTCRIAARERTAVRVPATTTAA